MFLGDVHFYGYTVDPWNQTTYPITRFLSETGIQALPSLETWLEVTQNVSDLQFESPFVLHREHSNGRLTDLQYVHCTISFIERSEYFLFYRNQIRSNLPEPVTNTTLQKFVDMIYLSQINQAMTLKSISDVCRMHSSVNMIDPRTSQG